MSMSKLRASKQYLGVRALLPPDLQYAKRNPLSTDTSYVKGTLWLNTTLSTSFMWSGTSWIAMGSGTTGGVVTLTGGTGGALSPTVGNMNILGTAGQLTSTGSGSTVTFSLPAVITAPGSLATTTTLAAGTTLTAGTTITATLGNITATNGNLVSSTAGKGLLFAANTSSGTAAGGVTLNSRAGQAVFTTVSIAAAADLTLVLTNSAISASTTQIIYSWFGATTGSALSIKSVVNAAGSSTIVMTNGTGATTSTSNITFNFIVVN